MGEIARRHYDYFVVLGRPKRGIRECGHHYYFVSNCNVDISNAKSHIAWARK